MEARSRTGSRRRASATKSLVRMAVALVSAAAVLATLTTTGAGLSPPPLPPGNPIGHLDGTTVGPGDGSTTDSTVQVVGWALDPDTTAPIYVDLYVDSHMVGRATANQSRPDVGKAFPDYGPLHGFSMPVAMTAGTHQLCAYGINTESGNANPSLGCQTVKIKANPLGDFESLKTAGPTSLRAVGWAIDPNVAAPISIAIYVDYAEVTQVVADGNRPDIAAAYPAWGADHGFDVTFSVPPGNHLVQVYGLNVGTGVRGLIYGSWYGRTTGVPMGNLDHVSVSMTDHSLVTVGGWTFDPDTPTTPINASVWFWPNVGSARSIGLTANQERDDVAAAFPWVGVDHGFSATVRLPSGTWLVCGYGINVGSGTGNPQLGNCWHVVIP